MTNPTELPLTLHKANLQLQTRLVKLVQEHGRHWQDFNTRLSGEAIAESDSIINTLRETADWQTLVTLPADAFWRQVQQRFGDSQAVAQIAVTAQTAFADGLKDAIEAWQRDSAAAISSGVPALSAFGGQPGFAFDASAWNQLFKPWQSWLAASPAGTTGANKPKEKKS